MRVRVRPNSSHEAPTWGIILGARRLLDVFQDHRVSTVARIGGRDLPSVSPAGLAGFYDRKEATRTVEITGLYWAFRGLVWVFFSHSFISGRGHHWQNSRRKHETCGRGEGARNILAVICGSGTRLLGSALLICRLFHLHRGSERWP